MAGTSGSAGVRHLIGERSLRMRAVLRCRCEQIAPLMPQPGESRADVADIFLHVHNRLVEIVAGTEGERLFLPGKPWFATDDERQAVAYGSLIPPSPESAPTPGGFGRGGAAGRLRAAAA